MASKLNHAVIYQRISPLCYPTRYSFQPTTGYRKGALSAAKKRYKRNNHPAMKIATPAMFQEKMVMWRDLIKLEIKSETDKIKKNIDTVLYIFWRYLTEYSWNDLVERGLAMGHLLLTEEFYHPVLGYVAEFKQTQALLSSKFFREGVPLVICKGSNIEHVTECIFLKCTNDIVRVGLRKDVHLPRNVGYFSLIPSTNAAALQKIEDFLHGFDRSKHLPGFDLLRIAYRSLPLPSVYSDRISGSYPETFNESQKRAVDAALNRQRPFVVVHGPPGTGKTAVVCEIIVQAVKQKQKVLVCAPSHLAVDNILDRVKNKVDTCRIGLHREGSLDSFIQDDVNFGDLVKLTEQMNLARETMPKHNRWNFYKLRQKARVLRSNIERSVLESKDVIFSTLLSGELRRLCNYGYSPDLMIIDEAAQAYECVSWLAMMCAKRCVLAGDHHQLSALVQSPQAAEEGLGISLMESLCDRFGPLVSHLLTVQYRMHEKIMRWSSDQFYYGKLEADSSVANSTLSDISTIPKTSVFNEPLLMFDTYSRHSSVAKEEFHKLSYKNEEEASLAVDCVKFLENSGINRRDIGIITPYYAQVAYLRSKLDPDIVKTVDGFQGQQKEVIIMSLVRDNYSGDVGFLQDKRRLNVAVTRAKKQFVLIGNSHMMKRSPYLASLLNYISKLGVIIPVRDPSSGVFRRIDKKLVSNVVTKTKGIKNASGFSPVNERIVQKGIL